MSETPDRVRVTAPPRQRPRVEPRAGELDRDTRLGGLYLRSLLREQLWLAARTLGAVVLLVGSLPLVFHLAPGLAATTVLGLPLGWLVLGGLVYPVLVLLAWRYVRRAEATERDFADLMSEQEP